MMAINQANISIQSGDLPIGAALVYSGEVILGRNTQKSEHRIVAHAELNVIRQAWQWKGNKNMAMYSTLEPCTMCSQALLDFGVKNVFYAVEDPIAGGSQLGTGMIFTKLEHIDYLNMVLTWLKAHASQYPEHFEYFSKKYKIDA